MEQTQKTFCVGKSNLLIYQKKALFLIIGNNPLPLILQPKALNFFNNSHHFFHCKIYKKLMFLETLSYDYFFDKGTNSSELRYLSKHLFYFKRLRQATNACVISNLSMKVEAKIVALRAAEKLYPQDAEARKLLQRIWSLQGHGKPRSPIGFRCRFYS